MKRETKHHKILRRLRNRKRQYRKTMQRVKVACDNCRLPEKVAYYARRPQRVYARRCGGPYA